MTLRSVCLHGPESTGKSTIGPRLAAHFGSPYVPEYGRTYAEEHGTDFTMADLVAIAEGHDAQARAALATGPYPVILDTDPLMTAAWATMLFGRQDAWFAGWDNVADAYLLFDIDLPWVDDGTRLFGSSAARHRFLKVAQDELTRRNVPWMMVSGTGDCRYINALLAIQVLSVSS